MNISITARIKQHIANSQLRRKLRRMDDWYYHSLIGPHIMPNPPSYYYNLTPEEIAEKNRQSKERIKKLLDELDD